MSQFLTTVSAWPSKQGFSCSLPRVGWTQQAGLHRGPVGIKTQTHPFLTLTNLLAFSRLNLSVWCIWTIPSFLFIRGRGTKAVQGKNISSCCRSWEVHIKRSSQSPASSPQSKGKASTPACRCLLPFVSPKHHKDNHHCRLDPKPS